MTDISFGDAKTQHLRCRCGHPRSRHAQASHKRYELGHCKAYVPVPEDIQQCPCEEYEPVREGTT